jgi:hypothetical protein
MEVAMGILDRGANESELKFGGQDVKAIRFWAEADTWDRATISVRVAYREWLQASRGYVEEVEIGTERRYRPSSVGRGTVLPHVEILVLYRDRAIPLVGPAGSNERIKAKFATRVCDYCGKEFDPKGSTQRFCNEVCRSWDQLERAEKRAAERGLNRDNGGL